jgi:hypothetical protein
MITVPQYSTRAVPLLGFGVFWSYFIRTGYFLTVRVWRVDEVAMNHCEIEARGMCQTLSFENGHGNGKLLALRFLCISDAFTQYYDAYQKKALSKMPQDTERNTFLERLWDTLVG